MNDRAIIHYSEIALKGKNRNFFENALFFNIQKQCKGFYRKVRRVSGRLMVEYEPEQERALCDSLLRVFGIHHFEFGTETEADLAIMKKEAYEIFGNLHPTSFRVSASRSEKKYPFTSMELEKELGRVIHEGRNIPVSLNKPEMVFSVEVADGRAYLTTRRIEGLGGLPVGSSGKIISLLSGGFDSPVATLRMMKRGCVPALVHFHSYPNTSKDSIENVKKISKILSSYSPNPLRLFLVQFADFQKKIMFSFPSKLRVVEYRRWMLWISEKIAESVGARALVTGDSVGQVSSQTIENIDTVSEAVSLPILRPLAGYDKEEIISLSKFYGIYDVSSSPFDDCCSLFVDGSPATKTTPQELKNIEKENLESFINEADNSLKTAETILI